MSPLSYKESIVFEELRRNRKTRSPLHHRWEHFDIYELLGGEKDVLDDDAERLATA